MAINPDGSRKGGKGGSFTSTPNIFGKGSEPIAPSLADDSTCGLSLDTVLRSGSAVILGLTRDGGALCITILSGAEKHRTYCSNQEQLEQALAVMRESFSE